MLRSFIVIATLILASVSVASDHALVQPVSDQRLLNATNDPANWITHGRDYAEQRFSPLAEINTETVGELDLAWYYDFDDKRGLQATPLVIDGVMYVTASWSVVVALDAQTGELLWKYDPQVPREEAYRYCCGAVNRGVAAWGESVFVGTLDGRLIAIDRATEQPGSRAGRCLQYPKVRTTLLPVRLGL